MKYEFLKSYIRKALYHAAANNAVDIISSLLAMKYATPQELGVALTYASMNNYPRTVQMLIDTGADLNHVSALGTPLTEAIYEENIEIVRILLESGADRSIPEYGEVLPLLTIAAGKGNLEIVQLLVKAGADVNQIAQSSGAFALDSAAGGGYEDVFKYLAPLTNPELREEAEKILLLGISETEGK
ncbi:MAG: ankyrin repeat domain-containing protein [Nostoc sp.]|uniref:ankyrin repeat domain-containing protein n=1 Tax=Nostoc sp. TaxID=1180 RepID=UPI002FF7BAE8